jgi:2,3-bisphosphoglycerate-independent phosphoglycerate mutase
MKYIVILGDGMADRPIDELGGKTPLQAAEIPTIDMLASKGEIGLAATIPPGMKPGSDTANLAVLGYDPQVFYSGRSPLEALSIGAPMEANDVAMRVNIVTISDEEGIPFEERKILDHSAGEIPTKEAKELLEACMEELQNDEFKFYVGTSYRHCCIWANGQVLDFEQPHDHLSEKIGPVMPADERFARMTKRSF